ncbi:MAG: DUF2179 domain-containing protein [Chloroflexi bacterium]|nr:MAG: DUF2179 domain-containing protein [Chloroflexota bacterium]
MIAVWLFKNYTQPTAASTLEEFIDRARIGAIPGEIVFGSVILFSIAMIVLGLATAVLQDAPGEVLPHYRVFERLQRSRRRPPRPSTSKPGAMPPKRAVWNRPHARRDEYLTMIITDKGSECAAKVMVDLGRGVTALHGEGMYLKKPREVLICALTETELELLKQSVAAVDPAGFVVVMPATEVSGRGFMPLQVE